MSYLLQSTAEKSRRHKGVVVRCKCSKKTEYDHAPLGEEEDRSPAILVGEPRTDESTNDDTNCEYRLRGLQQHGLITNQTKLKKEHKTFIGMYVCMYVCMYV